MAEPIEPLRFGTDGWRGIIADDFTFERLRRAASATAAYAKTQSANGPGSILIGYDRRFMSRAFADLAAAVIAAEGIPVQVSAHPMPTPAVSLSVVLRKASWGIVITASHNPALYNGFKIKDRHGRSAPGEVTRGVEALLSNLPAPAVDRSTKIPLFDDRQAYEAYLRKRLDMKMLRTYQGRVVVDHLYGVASGIPERLLKGLRREVVSLHSERDALFGGLHPEPIESQLGDLQAEVRKRRAGVGIALDGDADRLGVVDEKGRYLTPHQVFPLLLLHCIEHKGWKGKVVQEVSLGYLSERIARHYGLPFEEVPVGFKHIAERMLQGDFLAGGEESGGYAVRGGLPERDGILNGLLFVEMLAARKQSPSQLLRDVERRFGAARFRRIDIPLKRPVQDRTQFVQELAAAVPSALGGEAVANVRTLDGLKVVLKTGAWVLLRPSGTEPLIRTYAETESFAKTDALLSWASRTAKIPEAV